MASQGVKSLAFALLFLDLMLYAIVSVIAGWAINYGINETYRSAYVVPVKLFPIFYPIGNLATGFFLIFSLIAGLIGIATSLTGLHNVSEWSVTNLSAAAVSSVTTWALVLLAMGLACKEISIGWRTASLRTLETLVITLSGTQLLCMVAIHAGLMSVLGKLTHTGGGRI